MTLERIALISDVHGNGTALEAVLADIAVADEVGMPTTDVWSVELRTAVHRGWQG